MEAVGLAVALAVGVTLLSSAVAKSVSIENFQASLHTLFGPYHALEYVKWVVPGMEALVGVLCLTRPDLVLTHLSVAALGAMFFSAGVFALVTKVRVTCACFGTAAHNLGWRQVLSLPIWLLASAAMGLTPHGLDQGYLPLLGMMVLALVQLVRSATPWRSARLDRLALGADGHHLPSLVNDVKAGSR